MSQSNFVSNLDEMNDGENFSKDLLKVRQDLLNKIRFDMQLSVVDTFPINLKERTCAIMKLCFVWCVCVSNSVCQYSSVGQQRDRYHKEKDSDL